MRGRPALVLSALFLVAAVQRWTHGRPVNELPAAGPPVKLAARPVRGGHPRLLLDEAARKRLQAAAKKSTPAWRVVAARCERVVDGKGDSGYWGFDWAYALADLSLCWHATGDAKWARGALVYLDALLDDRRARGDAKGGDLVVTHDEGYGIRTHGVYAALAYDWLHDAPGMTAERRAKILTRLRSWLGWYKQKGYHNHAPASNYYLGWFAADVLAGLAAAGESPDAAEWLSYGRDVMLGGEVIPFFATHLRGGDFPEGWQYGELSGAEVGIVAEALRTATGEPVATRLPWLGETVLHHMHALLPGSAAVYDGGDWSDRPCKTSRVALTGAMLALDATDGEMAARARWMLHEQLAAADDIAWLTLLAERPDGKQIDPHVGAPLSQHAPGTGLTLARSAWTPDALFVSFQAGPRLADDHQHFDQGHFELWRGPDGLLVDGSDYGSYGTLNHNTLLVDDHGAVLDYSPNQGGWGYRVRTLRYGDDGSALVAVADLTDAYLPACSAHDGCDKRAVRSALRTFVYLRPATVVVDDRLQLVDGAWGTIFAAHTTVAPELTGDRATAKVGGSRLELYTVEPVGAEHAVVTQPTKKGIGFATQDDPWGPIWRIEIRSPRGAPERRFLHVATALPANADAPPVARIAGERLAGARVGARAVLFADETSGGAAELPRGIESALVAGLTPGAGYRAEANGCRLTVARGGSVKASSGGAISVPFSRCR